MTQRLFLSLLLLVFFGASASFAQSTSAPTSKTLTPAEQKRQEKLQREIEAQRKFKAEMAERQRQYYAEQAEKERKRKEKEAAKAGTPIPSTTPTPAPSAPASTNQPATTGQASDMTRQRSPETERDIRKTQADKEKAERQAQADRERAAKKEQADREKADRQAAKDREKAERDRQAEAAKARTASPQSAQTETNASSPSDTEKAARQAQTNREREAARQQKEAARQQREAERERERLAKQSAAPASTPATAQPEETEASRPAKQFLPKDHLFAPILLDPLQSQTSGSVLPIFSSNGERYKGTIVPFSFGIQKPFFRRNKSRDRASEWALDVASFTQFEVYQDEKVNKQRRQLINTDYRVGFSYHLRRGPATWRFRAYHLSSHLGDDYIIRNQLNFRLPNAVNYELIDATYSRQVRDVRLYGGLGVGLRVSDERKPLSAQAGFWYQQPSQRNARWVGGLDLKLWQQTDFRPGIKAGAGVAVGNGPNNLTFLLETYTGFRPYSIYETDRVFWLGVGVYLQPF